ncbi:response regulator transcription factor [Cupriavidus basilensis]|uniref:response regulator transcription factor n=1 Tax=Cupriavidus basilensis TaxID=68895 RepID=UPI00075175A3|nr:response regulator transcription factor [Cupriavidus basilensis]
MRILLVEDDQKAARLLARGLQEEGYVVEIAHSAEAAGACDSAAFNLVILDWMLPGKSGVAYCQELREQGVRTPILMLTARDALTDRIAGLDTGADDYLTKPFVFEELLAHVRALLRRMKLAQPALLSQDDLVIDPQRRIVTRAGVRLVLTPKEYAILVLLIERAGAVVSRAQLAEHIWHADLIAIDNLIDVHMKNLRRKLDPPDMPMLIQTVRGQGFRLVPAGAP